MNATGIEDTFCLLVKLDTPQQKQTSREGMLFLWWNPGFLKEVSLLSTLKNIGKRRSWWESCFQNQEKEIIEEKAKVIQGRMVAFCPCLKDPFFLTNLTALHTGWTSSGPNNKQSI